MVQDEGHQGHEEGFVEQFAGIGFHGWALVEVQDVVGCHFVVVLVGYHHVDDEAHGHELQIVCPELLLVTLSRKLELQIQLQMHRHILGTHDLASEVRLESLGLHLGRLGESNMG